MAQPSFTLPLDRLHFGHEATPPINARRTSRDSEIEALAASILAHGQIQPLSVAQIEGRWYVADGNRRLAALRHLAEAGSFPADGDVACTEIDGDAEEISLAANVMRTPLHEADSLETFRDLAARGMSEADIGARFGIPATRVRKILAIGSLSPIILAAWREGRFGDQAAACVRAFTLARDHAHQAEVFAQLEKQGHLYPHSIRQALGAGGQRAGQLLAFIGREAYRDAGGAVIEDLFGDNLVLSDVTLAERLAAEKLQEACETLLAEGWKWARPAAELAAGWHYNWRRLQAGSARANPHENKRLKALRAVAEDEAASAEARAEAAVEIVANEEKVAGRGWSAEQKAEAGCAVDIGPKGGLSIIRGLVDPADARKAEKVKAAAGTGGDTTPKEATVSAALVHRLSVQATLAMRDALAEAGRLGLVTLLAGFLTVDFFNQPIRVRHEGYGRTPIRDGDSFRDVFARLDAMTGDELLHIGRRHRRQGPGLHHPQPAGPTDARRQRRLCAAALDPDRLHAALAGRFDAQDYFPPRPKPSPSRRSPRRSTRHEARKAGKLGKADLVAFAVGNVPPTGWLPPELRAPTYAGPGAVSAGRRGPGPRRRR